MDMSEEPGNQDGMNARVTKLETNVEVIRVDVSVLKTDVSVLKTDVSVLKTDVSALRTDVSMLKNNVAALAIELGVIKATGASKTDVAELHIDLSEKIVKVQGEMIAQIERLRADTVKAVHEGRTATIVWISGAVFFAHFLPAISQFLKEF